MAKLLLPMKESGLGLPLTGRWTWKDDTNTLEFLSNIPAAERQDKRRKLKAHDPNKSRHKLTDERVTPSTTSTNVHQRHTAKTISRAKSIRQKKDMLALVTIEDIKSVACDLMSEVKAMDDSFGGLYQSSQFNDYLLHLLSYFNCYFEKMEQENKRNPMYIEPSPSEKRAYANACTRLEIAKKFLGQSYCTLVLGLGLDEQHHMMCGNARVSNTRRDRSMFETFYTFCNFVVWITFRRKEFEVIKKEIGRMLRSDTFNPAIRIKYASLESDLPKPPRKENGRYVDREGKLSSAEYRRLHPKRPAIKSIVNQRSPAIIALLPSAKEESPYLFKRFRPLSPASLSGFGSGDIIKEDDEIAKMIKDLTISPKTFKVGILGELLSNFNQTLTPLGAEAEDTEAESSDLTPKVAGEEPTGEKTPGKMKNQQVTLPKI